MSGVMVPNHATDHTVFAVVVNGKNSRTSRRGASSGGTPWRSPWAWAMPQGNWTSAGWASPAGVPWSFRRWAVPTLPSCRPFEHGQREWRKAVVKPRRTGRDVDRRVTTRSGSRKAIGHIGLAGVSGVAQCPDLDGLIVRIASRRECREIQRSGDRLQAVVHAQQHDHGIASGREGRAHVRPGSWRASATRSSAADRRPAWRKAAGHNTSASCRAGDCRSGCSPSKSCWSGSSGRRSRPGRSGGASRL